MCVICRKAKAARLPDAKTIEAMWDANPDGAGVMWRDGRSVCYVKGFMDRAEFMGWVERNRAALDATECALHFRITTHGGTNQQNCHPFPLDRKTKPHALTGCCKAVLMHNGVLPLKPRDERYSDTAELTLRAKESGDAVKYIKSVAEFVATSSRLCVFTPKETLLVGAWKKRDGDDCDYSNLNFERRTVGYEWNWEAYDYWSRRTGVGKDAETKDAKDEKDGKDAKDEVPKYDFHYDAKNDVWKNALGRTVPIEEVDPYSLSDEDVELYYMMWEDGWDDEPVVKAASGW